MAGEINKLIPLYGELNRIYNDWVTNYAFSFDKQKFITDFYRPVSYTHLTLPTICSV